MRLATLIFLLGPLACGRALALPGCPEWLWGVDDLSVGGASARREYPLPEVRAILADPQSTPEARRDALAYAFERHSFPDFADAFFALPEATRQDFLTRALATPLAAYVRAKALYNPRLAMEHDELLAQVIRDTNPLTASRYLDSLVADYRESPRMFTLLREMAAHGNEVVQNRVYALVGELYRTEGRLTRDQMREIVGVLRTRRSGTATLLPVGTPPLDTHPGFRFGDVDPSGFVTGATGRVQFRGPVTFLERLVDGTLVVGTETGHVHWIRNGRIEREFDTFGNLVGRAAVGAGGRVAVANRTSLYWFQGEQLLSHHTLPEGQTFVSSPIALRDGRTVAFVSGNRARWFTRERALEREVPLDPPATGTQPLALADSTLVYTTARNELRWVDGGGQVRHTFALGSAATGPMLLLPGATIVVPTRSGLQWFDATGRVREVAGRASDPFTSVSRLGDGSLLALTEAGTVLRLSEQGVEISRTELRWGRGLRFGGETAAGEIVVVGDSNVHWLRDGRVVERLDMGAATGVAPLVLPDGSLVTTTRDGALRFLSGALHPATRFPLYAPPP